MVNNKNPVRQKRLKRMRGTAVTLVIFAAAGLNSFGQSSPPSTQCDIASKGARFCANRLYLKTSDQFLHDHDIQKAADGFTRVTQLAPDYAAAWFNLAVIAEQRHDWPQAKAAFQRYLSLTPAGVNAKKAAQELETLEPYVAGLATPAQAKQAEYDASIRRARLLLNSELFREAVSEASHAQSIDDSRWEAYAVVALVMYKQHKDVEGHRFADLAIQRSPVDKKDAIAKALVPIP